MEAIQGQTPNPAMGISTRSQSQIQLSRTRSGRVINKRSRPSDPSDEPLTSLLIKDLRVKRVFSQTLNPPAPIADTKSEPVPPLTSSPELKIDSEIKTTVVKARKRVFKAPGSFSYKRMLPYLKDINQDNSCVLEICEVPNQLNTKNNSKDFRSLTSDSPMESVQVPSLVRCNGDRSSSESPEYVAEIPSVVVDNQCRPNPPVDGKNGNINLGVEVQKLDVSEPFSSSRMEDCQVNTDGVTAISLDGNTSVENIVTDVQIDIFSSSKDQIVKDLNMDERYSCQDNEVVQHKESSKQAQCEGSENIRTGYPSDIRSPNQINEQGVGDAEEVLKQKCDLHEESIQMTPPDADILDKLQMEVKLIDRAENGHPSTDLGLGKPRNGNDCRNFTQVEVRHGCSTKRNMVLNPCSRLKLFKRPGSVSYRRLLPFLMDMKKGASVSRGSESAVTDLVQSQPLSPSQLGPPIKKSNVALFHAEPGTPAIQLTNANGSSSIDGPNIVSPEHMTGSQVPCNAAQKEMHDQQTVSGKQRKMNGSPNIGESFRQTAELPVPIFKKDVKTSGPELPVTRVSHGTVGDFISSKKASSDDGKPDEANTMDENSSKIDATSNTQAITVRKGIIKRNPRGCRGLCTCLNCTSFRLHAERAFEFSRNQMQDAEEVSLHLMMELSKLRKLLEKSAATNDHDVTSDEVKSACRKASEAEDLARNRIEEMNYDLNIHCRITCLHEPRVRFANLSEEKVIPKRSCSSDKRDRLSFFN